jgi:hypothetical protein
MRVRASSRALATPDYVHANRTHCGSISAELGNFSGQRGRNSVHGASQHPRDYLTLMVGLARGDADRLELE